MNYRYAVGHSLALVRRWLLSRAWFPLLRTVAQGVEWPYDVCQIRGQRHADLIFDVGANVGQTSRYLLRFFPAATIHAFELAGETTRQLRQALARYPRAHAHHLALGAAEGVARVALQSCSESNSLVFAAENGGTNTEEVPITTVDRFCAERGIDRIDVLKIDAQGYDLAVLQGAEEFLSGHRIGFIYVEAGFSPHQPDLQAFAPLHQHLEHRGYRLSGIYEQWRQGHALHSFNALFFHPSFAA